MPSVSSSSGGVAVITAGGPSRPVPTHPFALPSSPFPAIDGALPGPSSTPSYPSRLSMDSTANPTNSAMRKRPSNMGDAPLSASAFEAFMAGGSGSGSGGGSGALASILSGFHQPAKRLSTDGRSVSPSPRGSPTSSGHNLGMPQHSGRAPFT